MSYNYHAKQKYLKEKYPMLDSWGGNPQWVTIRGTNLVYNWFHNHHTHWYIATDNELKGNVWGIDMKEYIRLKNNNKYYGSYPEAEDLDIIVNIPDAKIRNELLNFIAERELWIEEVEDVE